MKKLIPLCFVLAIIPAHAEEGPPPDSTKHANMMGLSHFPQSDGEALYKGVCAACHMQDAKGGAGAGYYPALAGNQKLEVSSYPVMMVVNGNKAMPSFKNAMTDAQIAAVVTYVRTHFGNSYADPVTIDEVREAREAGK